MKKTNYTTLFEQQSYYDAVAYYQDLLAEKPGTVAWDYVILTASNEAQAAGYEEQLAWRRSRERLPRHTHFAVVPDPDGRRVGSGGATFNVLRYLRNTAGTLEGLRVLVIHSGGDSKRVPQYSACGKLFSPVPCLLPDGRRSTLFDEFMIGMSTVAGRLSSGMLVCSGDVLLLFNALQIDFYSTGAAALSIKENVDTGKNHGVYRIDEDGNVGEFLHKQSIETLTEKDAVDAHGRVDIDTGAVILSSPMLTALYTLIDTPAGFDAFVNEEARVSFYADFLYPLASGSTLGQFYHEKPEGDDTEQLRTCRTALWEVLHPFRMKLIRLSPASFIHFGTTRELLRLMATEMEDYRFLGWSGNIGSNVTDSVEYAISNSYISRHAVIGAGSYIEDCAIHHGSRVGEGCVLSAVTLNGETVPAHTVLHGLKLADGRFVVRCYAVEDNPKESRLFEQPIEQSLWTAPLYPVCATMEEAVRETLATVVRHERTWTGETLSLKDSFNRADVTAILPWQEKLHDRIQAESVLQAIEEGVPVNKIHIRVTDRIRAQLLAEADRLDENVLSSFGKKIRIYYYLSKLENSSEMADRCFGTIRSAILQVALSELSDRSDCRIAGEEVTVRLPVRVNFGGGWSDTPPYCMEHGGTVLNAAVSFDGELPIEVTVRKIDEPKIVLASTDIGSYGEFTDISALQDCRNPSDAFALHKAALIACGLIPYQTPTPVAQLCDQLGGGVYLNTRVLRIPKGSGLGTSSILAGACVKALYRFIGQDIGENELYNRVLCMEQLMSTGGGWQDQVGGLAPGFKMVTTVPGMRQTITCTPLMLSDATRREMNERFCLVYTGQRRLARNLLREVVGNYIGNDPNSLAVHDDIQRLAVLMRFELEKGNVNGFAELLNQHWELSKRLDAGCTNTCIDQIFNSVADLIEGHMICGAGGGGFLQVVLKKGVDKQTLKNRLHEVFADSGVDVWGCRFE